MIKLLTLGDSIALGYRKSLITALGADYAVSTKEGEEEAAKNLNYPVGTNCGDSRMMLSYLRDEKAGNRLNYDVIVFNCGLHDIKYNWDTEKIQIEPAEYEQNLRRICAVLNSTGAEVFFVNSTPVYDDIHNSTQNIIINQPIIRRAADLEKYNEIAEKVMNENGIAVIDLYTFTLNFGKKAVADHVHYTAEYADMQGKFIADFVTKSTKR